MYVMGLPRPFVPWSRYAKRYVRTRLRKAVWGWEVELEEDGDGDEVDREVEGEGEHERSDEEEGRMGGEHEEGVARSWGGAAGVSYGEPL
jgi:hypothetical protein